MRTFYCAKHGTEYHSRATGCWDCHLEEFPPAEMRVLTEVQTERASQDVKWGEQNHPDGTGPYLSVFNRVSVPSHGNLNRMICQEATTECNTMHAQGRGTWQHILTEEWAEAIACDNPTELRVELIQVAAVAVAWVEAIDRRLATVDKANS